MSTNLTCASARATFGEASREKYLDDRDLLSAPLTPWIVERGKDMGNRFIKMGLLLGAAAVFGAPSAAVAAPGDWSGFYAGIEGGAASGKLRASGNDAIIQLSNVFVPGRGLVVVPGTSTPSDG